MKIKTAALLVTTTLLSGNAFSETGLEGRNLLTLDNGSAIMRADLSGGCIAEFSLKDIAVNPLKWSFPEKGYTGPQTMGHFICFDRWGQPSDGEKKFDIPYHGEATKVEWKIVRGPEKKKRFDIRRNGLLFAHCGSIYETHSFIKQ